jgi:hypothetical protein
VIVGIKRMGDVDVTVDPIVLTSNSTGQVATGDAGPPITGDAAPLIPKSWWPWILLAAVGGVIWYLVANDDEEEEGSGDAAPFVG